MELYFVIAIFGCAGFVALLLFLLNLFVGI